VMLNKQDFSVVFYFSPNQFFEFIVVMPFVIIDSVHITQYAVFMSMIIGELCPEIDFDLLNCRKKKPPQFSVKFIDLIYRVEVCTRQIISIGLFEGQEIRRQAIIVYSGQNFFT
jgi:hypothetical protein